MMSMYIECSLKSFIIALLCNIIYFASKYQNFFCPILEGISDGPLMFSLIAEVPLSIDVHANYCFRHLRILLLIDLTSVHYNFQIFVENSWLYSSILHLEYLLLSGMWAVGEKDDSCCAQLPSGLSTSTREDIQWSTKSILQTTCC